MQEIQSFVITNINGKEQFFIESSLYNHSFEQRCMEINRIDTNLSRRPMQLTQNGEHPFPFFQIIAWSKSA